MITLTEKQAAQVHASMRFLAGLNAENHLEIQVMDTDGGKVWDVEPGSSLYEAIKADVLAELHKLGVEPA